MILRLSMVKLNCCVLSQCLQNIIIWYWARKFCLRKFTRIKVWRRKNEPVWYRNTDPEMPVSAKKRWINAKTSYCPFMCSCYKKQESVSLQVRIQIFFPWGVGWPVPFASPEYKSNNSKGEKMFFHCDQNWRYFWKPNFKVRATSDAAQNLDWGNDHHRFLCFQWWRLSAARCLQWAFPCWRLPWPGPFCRCSKTRRRPDSGPRRRAACVWFPVRYHHTVIVILSLNCM